MTDNNRRRFESLESLRRAAYESLNDRRSYEWKLSLSIWTALAILLAGLLQPAKTGEVFPLKGPCVGFFAFIFGALLVILHAYWSNGASRANSVDRKVMLHFAHAMQNMLNLPYEEALQKEIADLPATRGWTQWSHIAQIFITFLLALASALIICIRSSQSHP